MTVPEQDQEQHQDQESREGHESLAAADERPPRSARHSIRATVEWVLIIVLAIVGALVIKTYLLQAFYIPSGSMEPTLQISDRVFVNKLSYKLHDVHRGDIVVFELPPGQEAADPAIKDLIKRVVGLPGETVEGHDGRVFVNGSALRETYLPKGTVTGSFPPTKLGHNQLWVMGDNRGNSKDSRVFGAIDEHLVVGRAFVRVWPPSALRLL